MNKDNNVRVLIVDDEASVREVLYRALDEQGYHCITAADTTEAIAALDSCPVDMVLTDIMMPGMTGVDLLREVQKKCPDTAVMMLTAVVDTQTAIEAMKLGAYDYIMKPFNIDEVILSVERVIEKRNLILANRDYRDHLEQRVDEQTDQIRHTFLGAVKALAEALDAKDPYTNGHSRRMTEIVVILAKEMNLPEDTLEKIRLAGMVHDIGKIGVSEEILHKPGKLSDEEFDTIRDHPVAGERILRPIVTDEVVLSMVRHHHERYAGGGYPEGIAGEKIPVGARLLAVADAYDAMTSNRPYRDALMPEKARSQLLANRGSQFDPGIVDIFIKSEEKMPFCPLSARPGKDVF